ncbi:MAG TPA: 1-(5-phosphoribosyl)-5-[(5-phosphoribosylamino)methylideneamino]imidazole-4-carboxamide isomerase, partial [Chitinophagaceae bacterium]
KLYCLMITIIPAIDIIEGKCVRLSGGAFETKKVYNEDPVEVAKTFEGVGLRRLHLVDLDGARTGSVKNWKVLEKIALKTSLVIDFGGGVHTEADVKIGFNSGAYMINIGSMAVKEKEELVSWMQKFGSERFLIGADVKEEKIMTKGWTEDSGISVYDFIEDYMKEEVRQFFCTDIAKDGMMKGPAIELYKKIIGQFPAIELIASGGVSNIKDVEELEAAGCTGVIIGKAFYEGTLKTEEIKVYVN